MTAMPSPATTEYIALISKHQSAIYAFVRAMVDNATDAEDIAQETNIALWGSMDRFEQGTNFYAYATRIAYNKVIDHSRRRKRHHPIIVDTELAEKLAATIGEVAGEYPHRRMAVLDSCVSKLKPEERGLLEQRYEHNRTVRQIAQEAGRSESVLQNIFSRIRNKLRICIDTNLIQSTPT
jgi:RNA polymerase sigma-70 factor (ECF subfamily)